MKSAIGYLQRSSNKSLVLMKAETLKFYSFHAASINVTERARWRYIMCGAMVIACILMRIGNEGGNVVSSG